MPSQKELMLAGESYLANDPELVDDRRRCREVTAQLNALPAAEPPQRAAILRKLLAAVGEETEILSPFHCDYGYRIEVGARSFVNFGAVILDSARVAIGDDVQIGPNVQIVTPLHPLDPERRRTQIESAEPVTIGDGAWLATGVIVCPGVTVGAGAVIGAGSVVVADVPPRTLAVGNPCRRVRDV